MTTALLPRACRVTLFLSALILLLSASGPPVQAAATGAETVCLTCHGSLPDRLGQPVTLWRGSVHAENGISCHACHGGQPQDAANAMNRSMGFLGKPKETEIPAFCGRCHPGVLKDYLASAHGRALGRGGPTCVSCHGNHQVLRASLELINEKSCSRCHSFERARQIRAAMEKTETRIVTSERALKRYQAEGVDTEHMGKALFSLRNRFHSLFHEVNLDRVKRESALLQGELDKLDHEIKGIEATRAQRKLLGGIVVGFLLAVAFVVHLFKKTFD